MTESKKFNWSMSTPSFTRLWATSRPTIVLPAPVFSEIRTSFLVRTSFQPESARSWPRHKSLGVPFRLGSDSKILIGSVGAFFDFALPSFEKSKTKRPTPFSV